jgi:hypothetical protein
MARGADRAALSAVAGVVLEIDAPATVDRVACRTRVLDASMRDAIAKISERLVARALLAVENGVAGDHAIDYGTQGDGDDEEERRAPAPRAPHGNRSPTTIAFGTGASPERGSGM